MLKVVWVWICTLDFGNDSFCVMSRIYYIMPNKKNLELFSLLLDMVANQLILPWQRSCDGLSLWDGYPMCFWHFIIRCNYCFVSESSPAKQNKQKKGSATDIKPAGKKRKLKDVEKEKKRQRLQQISKQQKQNKSGKPSGKPSGPHKKQQKHKKFKKTK